MKSKAKLFATYVLIAIITILSAEAVFWTNGYKFIDKQSDEQSVREAELFGDLYRDALSAGQTDSNQFVKEYGDKYQVRITIIDHLGVVIADSQKEAATMENHADREEVKEALAGETFSVRRKSFTLGMNYSYTAVPIETTKGLYVLRVAVPLNALTDLNIEFTKQIILSLLICFLAVIAFSAWLSQKTEDNQTEKKESFHILPFPDRNYKQALEDVTIFDGLVINRTTRVVKRENEIVNLSKKEFELLYLLVENRGRVFSREILLEQIWGYDYYGETRTVDVHIRNLRKKIEKDPDHPQYIVTVRGYGYKFAE